MAHRGLNYLSVRRLVDLLDVQTVNCTEVNDDEKRLSVVTVDVKKV